MIGRGRALAIVTVLAAHASSLSAAQVPVVGQAVEMDSAPLVDTRRLATLPDSQRTKWDRYLSRSGELWRSDRGRLEMERRREHLESRLAAPQGRDFSLTSAMTPEWFRSDSARLIGESIVSYQTPSGGWAKAVDFSKGRRVPGQSFSSQATDWHFTPTIDNDATTDELRFLALLRRARAVEHYDAAIARGIAYLLDAQMPNGCWPQVYPLQGGYHDAVTFNDGATIRVVTVLRDLATDSATPITPVTRARAIDAQSHAVQCLVDAQVVVDGRPTIWGQQHDPLTLAPTSGRSYELTSLAPDESARIGLFLMSVPSPAPAIMLAVHSAADWYRANRIEGKRYAGWRLTDDSNAGPLWGRMVEMGTNRPIFSNRDGIKLYDFSRLDDRKAGYRWFSETPKLFLEQYDRWSLAHPRR